MTSIPTNTQQSWQERLTGWIETQHGTAGWEQKLEAFISQEIQRAKEESARENEKKLYFEGDELLITRVKWKDE